MHSIRGIKSRLAQPSSLAFILLAAIALRLGHMGQFIEDPHAWVQAEMACRAVNFYQDGINLLKPSTCFMGDYKTLVLNFPLPETLVAVGYHILGGPNIIYARVVTLAFFLGSALYLFAIVSYLCNQRLARLTVMTYLVLPLGLFWSRAAAHIDFPAVFFSHAMLYYLLRGYDENRTALVIVGSIVGVFAFLVKAPYAFYLFLPLGFHMISHPKTSALAKVTPLLVIPVVSFLLWRYHAETTNASAPDWFFIPGYFKFVNMGGWYFGPLAQRLSLHNWLILGKRFIVEVASPLGFCLFVAGIFVRRSAIASTRFFRLWLVGCILYLLIFFNLNLVHDYYQIPFLAISSFFIAASLDRIWCMVAAKLPRFDWCGNLALLAIGTCLLANSVWVAETIYYAVDWVRVTAGRIVREYTPENSLIIAATSMPGAAPQDPRLLYQSQRNGWSVRSADLSRSVVQELIGEGAQYLAILSNEPVPVDATRALQPYPRERFVLPVVPKSVTTGEYKDWTCTGGGWQLDLYSLTGADIVSSKSLGRSQPPHPPPALPILPVETLSNIERVNEAVLEALHEEPLHLTADEDYIIVKGWAVDAIRKDVAAEVYIVVDGILYPAFYSVQRVDVSQYFGVPAYRYSSFEGAIPLLHIREGPHQLSIRIMNRERTGFYASRQNVTFFVH